MLIWIFQKADDGKNCKLDKMACGWFVKDCIKRKLDDLIKLNLNMFKLLNVFLIILLIDKKKGDMDE